MKKRVKQEIYLEGVTAVGKPEGVSPQFSVSVSGEEEADVLVCFNCQL